MKKDTKMKIDPKLEYDRELIIKLRRVTRPIQSEVEEIFYLYKKYIDPSAVDYCVGCSAAPMNSIQRYYWKVVALSL